MTGRRGFKSLEYRKEFLQLFDNQTSKCKFSDSARDLDAPVPPGSFGAQWQLQTLPVSFPVHCLRKWPVTYLSSKAVPIGKN